MAEDTNDRHDGVQIKVWVPAAFYDLLRAQSARNQTSVAAEARRLMQAGLGPVGAIDEMKTTLTALDRFMRLHMEPLAFIAAMDAAYGREAWRYQLYAVQPESMEHISQTWADRAAKRIQRKLHLAPDEEPPKGDEADGSDDGT